MRERSHALLAISYTKALKWGHKMVAAFLRAATKKGQSMSRKKTHSEGRGSL